MTVTAGKPTMVAIDGPASSGKSALAHLLAKHLGYVYYDTGALYRAVTVAALRANVDPADATKMSDLARRVSLEIAVPTVEDGRQYTVLLDGDDVTWDIVQPAIDANVSVVSAHPGVRQVLLNRQREKAAAGGVVMAGRDIGTVVCPEAQLKLYLEASSEVRAQRRTRQQSSRGKAVDYERVLEQIRQRDHLDSSRAIAPLRPADDAIIIETDHLTIEDEMRIVEGILEAFGA